MATHASVRSKAVYRTLDATAPSPPPANPPAAHSENGAQPALVPNNRHRDALKPHRRSRTPARNPKTARRSSYLGELALTAFVAAIIAYTWSQRWEGHLTPKTGTGYLLGIAGGVMMLSLLLYPLRKYWKPLHRAGSVRAWFTAHMMLGILGPLAIVVHSNYRLDSTNATVAMAVMGLVVASGIIGRYVYAQIYEDASGKRSEISELLHEAHVLRADFGAGMEYPPQIESELASYEAAATAYRQSRTGGVGAMLFLGRRARKSRARVCAEAQAVLSTRALREHWTVDELEQRISQVHAHFDDYFAAVQRAARLNFFARIFAFWHVLHMPLFLLLILAALGHVVAVHLY